MTDASTIAREYDRREAEAGGLAKANPRQIAEDIAVDLGVPVEHVRSALIDHFSTLGAG